MTFYPAAYGSAAAITRHSRDEELAEEAAEAGFDSVHEYLADLMERDGEARAERARDGWW